MRSADLLLDAFDRIRGVVENVVGGLAADELSYRAAPDANSITWLIWHLTRIQDDHIADVAGTQQIWTGAGWEKRFALPLEAEETGYGHSPDRVAAVRVESGDLLIGYHAAVHQQTKTYVGGLSDDDLDRVVDERWDPPVTLGVRLVSVISDDLQHAGQAAFVRGLISKR